MAGSHGEPEQPGVDELERDALGYPLRRKERWAHVGARSDFIGAMETELGPNEMVALVKRLDAEDPGYFVEWQRIRMAEREVQGYGDHRGAA